MLLRQNSHKTGNAVWTGEFVKLLNGEDFTDFFVCLELLYTVSGFIQVKMTGSNRLFKKTWEKYQ